MYYLIPQRCVPNAQKCAKGNVPIEHHVLALALDMLSSIPISHSKINKAVPPVTKEW